jgi:RHS repeat-associated protein
MGRVLNHSQTTTGSTFGFQYAYNLNGELELEGYPSGRQVRSCYDIASRPNQVQNVTGSTPSNYASGVTYTPHGAIQSLTLGNGLQENYGYSADRLQLTSVAAFSTAASFFSLTYGYCGVGVTSCTTNNGNLQSQQIARPNGTWVDSYSYDALNRLTAAQEAGAGSWSQGYGYDAFGNRWVAANTNLPALTNETPTLASQYTLTGNNQIYGWSYDGSGNLTVVGGTARSFTYDAENRQLTATVAGTGNSYAYDGEGRRAQKTAWGLATTYVYDAFGQLAAEYGTADDVGTKYLTADALGSTRLETTMGTGGPLLSQNYDYLPFGQELGTGTAGRDATFSAAVYPGAASGPSMKFTGKERDAESGLDYFGARYFSGAQGRFTSPDWSATPQPVPYADFSNPQSLNLYVYMRNNPLSGTDPDGHCCSWSDIQQFGSGFAATTYQPIVQAVSHPIDTLGALGSAVMHPMDTAVAIKDAVVDTSTAALSGDLNALGKVAGTVVSTLATAGVGKAATSLAEGAEISEAAAGTTTLYRAVGSSEATSIGNTGVFSASPLGTEFKGFFYSQSDAQSFDTRMTQMTGDTHTVVSGEAPTSLVNGSPVHNAATEGRGVLIKNENLPQVQVKQPNQ